MLLSLVVIFTQSIQLSKIVERFASLHNHFARLTADWQHPIALPNQFRCQTSNLTLSPSKASPEAVKPVRSSPEGAEQTCFEIEAPSTNEEGSDLEAAK